jgi:hypothetical protein
LYPWFLDSLDKSFSFLLMPSSDRAAVKTMYLVCVASKQLHVDLGFQHG